MAATDRLRSSLTPVRQLTDQHRLLLAVTLTGLVGGVTGAAYVASLTGLQKILWPTHYSKLVHWGLLIGIGLVIALLVRFLGDPGDSELLVNNIHLSGGDDDIKSLRSLVPVSLLGVAVGGGIGPEAPLTQTTGTLGSWVGSRFNLDRDALRVCTITGMAAGFTVLFAAPLGAAVFALEILHRRGLEYYEALVPAALGSSIGYVIYTIMTTWGLHAVWEFPAPPIHLHIADFGWAVACGVVGAIVAIAFTYLSLGFRRLFRPLPTFAKPIAAGVLLGAVAFVSPYALTFSEAQLTELNTMQTVAVGTLLLAVLGHLLSAPITMAGQWKGGFIIPLFFIGYCLGRVGGVYLPASNEIVLATALMVACNVGVTKTPLGSTLVVAEMAGVRLLPTMLIASLVCLALTSNVNLLHSQRRRDGVEGESEGEDEALGLEELTEPDPESIGELAAVRSGHHVRRMGSDPDSDSYATGDHSPAGDRATGPSDDASADAAGDATTATPTP